jgi:hypothetical protein
MCRFSAFLKYIFWELAKAGYAENVAADCAAGSRKREVLKQDRGLASLQIILSTFLKSLRRSYLRHLSIRLRSVTAHFTAQLLMVHLPRNN